MKTGDSATGHAELSRMEQQAASIMRERAGLLRTQANEMRATADQWLSQLARESFYQAAERYDQMACRVEAICR